jgi:hypothetical protein
MVPLQDTNEKNDLGFNPADIRNEDCDVRELYKDVLDIVGPSVFDIVFNSNWHGRPGIQCNFDPSRRDFHPTPNEFVEYLETVAPGSLSQPTIDWMKNCHQTAVDKTLEWREPNRPERL